MSTLQRCKKSGARLESSSSRERKARTYKTHEDVDLVFEGLVVLNFALLHSFNSHFDAYTLRDKEIRR
jgi:hypothetical protein